MSWTDPYGDAHDLPRRDGPIPPLSHRDRRLTALAVAVVALVAAVELVMAVLAR